MRFTVLPWFLVLSSAAPAAVVLNDAPIRNRWSFDYGIAFITSNNIEQIAGGQINIADGDAGGQIHRFTATYLLAEPDWPQDGRILKPQIELPLSINIVDENSRAPFLDYEISFQIRWRDFPWNRWVRTTVASGVGLSYSDRVYLMDRKRHPDRHRSHLKFNWPLQLTLAHPDYPSHQLTIFIAHQSGGHIFDRGGVNSLGFGYRNDF